MRDVTTAILKINPNAEVSVINKRCDRDWETCTEAVLCGFLN